MGELRAPCECTMYRCWGPQSSGSTIMNRGISGPLVNVQCIYVGDLRAPGLIPCIGDEGHQGHFNKKLSCIPNVYYLKAKCLKALQLLHVVTSTHLHIILLIHVYALAKIRQVKYERPVEKYARYNIVSRHASRRQRGLQCDL